ncbi:hypothetical protein WH221_05905 [Chryseobacterium culicis]|uniref:DUF4134 domain-containing protein n=1 Tax=Chryseobacterium culicis TaxID=680127 RepID=A0A2S9CZ92_CHRCI|nr:hypothetical protein [Chryseobacterium culicis]PRB85781.1 hypothetical protein CQ022_05865 [Chryseobacterium culicis]PRB90495.1 hypothetical protein CQ033_07120 [Chryseobacterium culicis]
MKNLKFMRRNLIALLLPISSLLYSQTATIDVKIKGWTETLKTSLNAGVAAFAIVGAFLIFVQYMQGNEQAQKNFVRFVIGLAIFGLVDVITHVFIPK